MIRKAIFPISDIEALMKEQVLANMDVYKKAKGRKSLTVDIDGEKIYLLSDRYKLFFTKGYTCVTCGLTATYFALEKHTEKEKQYHLNLYGTTNTGKEMLFTKDHIIPKCEGGPDEMDNYQTMCHCCNVAKGPNPVQHKQTPKEEDIHVRYFIQYKGQFLNIKPDRLIVNYVAGTRGAKGYTKAQALRYLQLLFDNKILTDKNINNYVIEPKKKFKLEGECCA